MNTSVEEDVTIISREEWNALPARGTLPPLTIPQGMFYANYADTFWCKEEEDCKKLVREVQKKHFKLGYSDIQFNFMIGGDGNIYEGVGWTRLVVDLQRPTLFDKPKLVIGLIGQPDDSRYIRRMHRTKERLLSYGLRKNYLKCGAKFQYGVNY